MPILHAGFKALRQNKKRRARNLKVKRGVQAAVKSGKQLLAEKKAEEAKTAVKKAIKLLDRAVAKGIIKKNTASRKKSRLMKKLNALNKK
jgi:small subunit ribosomal protein S20